jgi:PAS domain S-box-containing protein
MTPPKVKINLSPLRRKSFISPAQLERHFNTTPSGHHLLSARGIILWVNAAEAAMLGYSKKEMVGRSFLDFIEPQQRPDAWQRFQQKLRGQKVEKKVDRTCLKKDGTRVYVTSQDKVLPGPEGKRVLTALTDITELRSLQEQISELQRTEQIRLLAAGFAHEFNNLLSPVQNAGSLIGHYLKAASWSNADVDLLLEIIADCCRNGAELNRGIISYARNTIDPLTQSPLDLPGVVRSAITLFERTLNNRGVALEAGLANVAVLGNAAELHCAVLNLLINARDAIPGSRAGEIRVELKPFTLRKKLKAIGGRQLEPGAYVKLSVKDNGCGIDKAKRDKIFEPFFSDKNPAENHGLGLSMLLGILSRHNGGVTLESQAGVGTTFNLFIPAVLC